MGKKLYIDCDKLLTIKESMANGDSVCHADSCHAVNEAAPEVDEYEIGEESNNPPEGGNYCHVTESISEVPQEYVDFLMKYQPNRYSSWVVVDLFNMSTMPRYFEKKQAAYDFYKWMKIGGGRKPVLLNLYKINNNINEGYSYNRLNSIDLSEVGLVEYEWYFDEDEYIEWLQDCELTDSEEVRNQYYTEEVTYGVEYYDNETYHYMAGDQNLLYDDLDDLFGEDMAKQMLQNCIENGGGKFETYELYEKNSYDLTNPNELNDIAMKLFKHGEYYKDCRGFILSNGVIVYTPSEHNEICMIPGVKTKFDFIRMGNIRLLPNSIDIGSEPTYEQEEILRQVISSYADEELYLDIFDGNSEIGAKYVTPNWRYVMGEIDRFYSEGIKPQGSDGLYENIEYEVKPNEVDLSSFKKKDELVPNIWEHDTLNSRIRLRLLDIADDFWEFVNLTWVKPSGIVLTGSICNFNWSDSSDIDLHLIVDFDEIDEKTEFVRDYLDAKKNEWNDEHENLRIFGHQVELYVQNLDEMPHSNGIYDLEENDWIRKPNPDEIKSIGLNKFSIKAKAAEIMTIIDNMYDALASTDDDYEVREIGDDAKYLWQKVKDMRKSSLDNVGESGNGNIVYKIMRREGYLDKLWKLSTLVYDKSNSINESVSEKPTDKEYYWAKQNIYSADNIENYDYCKDIIDRYEADDRLYDKLTMLSVDQHLKGLDRNSEYILTNGKLVRLHNHNSVEDIGLNKVELLKMGNIRIIGGTYSNYVYIELAKCPNDVQEQKLLYYVKTCHGDVYVDITYDNQLKKSFCFDRKTFSPELILKNIKNYFNTNESIESHKNAIMLLKEEWVGDGNSEKNPYKKRWEAERKALKDFVCNFGTMMQSKEDDKGGKLYKCYWDKTISNLIGFNYCLCVQYDDVEMKPKSIVYIRACDKFSPNIKKVNYDYRGKDNQIGTYDDLNYGRS